MRATGARALERPRRKRGPGREAGVGVRVRREAAQCRNDTMLRAYPHPPLRGTFSRREKGVSGALSLGARRHSLRATWPRVPWSARAANAERGLGVRVRREAAQCRRTRGCARTLIRPSGAPSSAGRREQLQ
ncbi:hypothetical protein XANMN_12710 [Xanthomonas phaseoli pv. manihotis str. CIO151]|nr:hypothetical protein XANMN_12710 [Xanthomonas phaseoli pv. manihotis str. CIO151]